MDSTLRIAHDRDESEEFEPRYFVYDTMDNAVIYKGTYVQCLCVVGAYLMDEETTLKEINGRTNGFLDDTRANQVN